MEANADTSSHLFTNKIHTWTISTAICALGLIPLKILATAPWTLGIGLLVIVLAAFASFKSFVYPRIYPGKTIALASLLFSGALTYTAFGQIAYQIMWKHTFQLSNELREYKDPIDAWSVSYPKLWKHEQHRISGTTNHIFKPSRMTPTMYFSVASRINIGTNDLSLIVENFFMNLPKDAETQILEQAPTTLPSGHPAYRIIYEEVSQRIPLKNEILFMTHNSRLYFLTIGGHPRWFDRHHDYLRNLLYTLKISENPNKG